MSGIDIVDRRMPIFVPMATVPEYFSRQIRNARRFYIDLVPEGRAPVVVVCGGWERCSIDYDIHRETFPYFAIELVAGGTLSLTLAGREYTLGVGSMFAYGPGIPHRLRAASRDPLWKYFVDFTGTQARELLRRSRLPIGRVCHVSDPLAIRELLDGLISAGLRPSPERPAICSLLTRALLLTVADTATERPPVETRSYATYRRCRNWLEEHDSEVSTLAAAARHCHIDAAYLCRLFKRYDRESPYKLMQRLRMQRAAALLLEPGAMVKTVAHELRFSDPFHFSRAFRRYFGLAPTQLSKNTS